MSTNWALIVAYLGGLAAFVFATVRLVRRSERRLSGGGEAPRDLSVAESDGMAEMGAYLDRMTGELALPAADVAEVRAELADHLHDSIATLEAEGLDRDRAILEALGRLGPAAELGRQIRAAHQSTRRLLAGAGGGVFAAGGGFVIGYLGGFAVAVVLLLVVAGAAAGLSLVGIHSPDLTSQDHANNTVSSLLLAIALMFAAATATRFAVRTSAGLSRRTSRSISIFWAAAGALGFGWLAIFGLRGPQSWPSVAVAAAIPVVAVAAAWVHIERPMPHVGRWAIGIGLMTLTVTTLLLVAVSTSGPTTSIVMSNSQAPDLHLDTVAPMAPLAWLPDGNPIRIGWGGESSSSALLVEADLSASPTPPMNDALANWRDVRFEAWHALLDDAAVGYGIDPLYSSPFAVQPAAIGVLGPTRLEASFHFERLRDGASWWVVLTAIGPDGHRYILSPGGGGSTLFNGSVWDWLTAPQ